MFGYVRINKKELRVKELDIYEGYYCGLCKVLQEDYGIRSKFLLNYDCTFLAIAVAVALDLKIDTERCACTFKPLGKKKLMVKRNEALELAAAMNVFLGYYALEDGWQDNKNLAKGTGKLITKSALKKAVAKYPALHNSVKSGLAELHSLEKSKTGDIDAVSAASAKLLCEPIKSFCNNDTEYVPLYVLCDAIGRWVYVADAYNDREKDKRDGCYNPFNINMMSKEKVRGLLYSLLVKAQEAFTLLEPININESSEILKNVLCFGCADVTERVINETSEAIVV